LGSLFTFGPRVVTCVVILICWLFVRFPVTFTLFTTFVTRSLRLDVVVYALRLRLFTFYTLLRFTFVWVVTLFYVYFVTVWLRLRLRCCTHVAFGCICVWLRSTFAFTCTFYVTLYVYVTHTFTRLRYVYGCYVPGLCVVGSRLHLRLLRLLHLRIARLLLPFGCSVAFTFTVCLPFGFGLRLLRCVYVLRSFGCHFTLIYTFAVTFPFTLRCPTRVVRCGCYTFVRVPFGILRWLLRCTVTVAHRLRLRFVVFLVYVCVSRLFTFPVCCSFTLLSRYGYVGYVVDVTRFTFDLVVRSRLYAYVPRLGCPFTRSGLRFYVYGCSVVHTLCGYVY